MMELDELKKELNLKLEAGEERRSAEDFAALLKKKTLSVMQQLERSLRFEIIVAMVFTILCNVVLFSSDSWLYHTLFSILGVTAIIFMVILFLLFRRINSALQSIPVKQNLERLVLLIEEYTKRYLQLTLFLLPVCFALGTWLSYNDPDTSLRPLDAGSIMILSIAMLVSGFVVYRFTRWYLRKMYGNYLLQLKQLLREFDQE